MRTHPVTSHLAHICPSFSRVSVCTEVLYGAHDFDIVSVLWDNVLYKIGNGS